MNPINFTGKWIIASLILLLNCAGQVNQTSPLVSVQDGKYDSEYPILPTSVALTAISQSVYQISSLTFYRQMHFDFNRKLTREQLALSGGSLESLAHISQIIEKPAAGTGTVISYHNKQAVILTCAHTVSAPDTILHFFMDSRGQKTAFIERIDIRLRQSLNVIGLASGDAIEILAIDQESDLALLGKKITSIPKLAPVSFQYPLGKSDELEIGVFVYLIGFPHGKKMVLSSIVSAPVDGKNSFIVNATMHNGISGGLVLALRDGAPNFELVGMINALSASYQIVLKPEAGIKSKDIIPSQAYSGNIYLDEQIQIIDGISFAIPAKTIKSFLERQRHSVEQKGYIIPSELYH